MFTISYRSVAWFAAGVVLALIASATFIGVRSLAAPGGPETTFVPITPCRLFDYRPAPDTVGTRTTPLGPGETATQQVTGAVGNCTIPAGAAAVSMNVTIVSPTAQSNLRLFPADAATPLVSNLNWKAGQSPTPNKVDVKLSPAGAVKMTNLKGTVYVVADVVGYYTRSGLDALRTQTVTISGLSMTPETTSVITTWNGCARANNGLYRGWLQLPVPIGARIVNVTARVYDADAAVQYLVQMVKYTNLSTGDGSLGVAGGAGGTAGAGGVVVTWNLTPFDETVQPGEKFIVHWAGGTTSTNALCDVTVTYQLPGG